MQILYISKEQLKTLEILLKSKDQKGIEKKVIEIIGNYCKDIAAHYKAL